MNFKSQYSIRLYELLKMDAYKEKNGKFEKMFPMEELRLLFGVEKKDYRLFSDFRRYAIEPAVREISDQTDLNISDVNYGKTGRKITNVSFSVVIRSKNETNLRQANLRIDDINPEKPEKTGIENHPI